MFLFIIIALALLAVLGLVLRPTWKTGGLVIAASFLTGLFPVHAYAAAILLPPAVMDEINQLVVGVVVGLLLLAFKWVSDRSPLKNSQAEQIARDAFNALLYQGAKYGLSQLGAAESHVNGLDVGNAAVAAAANYVIAQGPGLAAKLGFDVSTENGRAAVIRMVTARVSDLMTPPDAPPAAVPLPVSVQAAPAPATK